MANPVNAFLAGMGAVDRLETNRQRRSFLDQQQQFARENQSWLRKKWAHEEDKYERAQLDYYRGQKLAELDAVVRDIVTNTPEKMRGMLVNPYAVMNEASKRMQAADPQFGEHVALALGHDPAAGALIKDKKNPVTGFGFSEEHGVFFALNTINGDKPLTENRSSADKDPIAFREVGAQELVKIFGPGVLSSDLLIAQQLRSLAGMDEVTGNPLETQDRAQRQGAATEEEAPPEAPAKRERSQREIEEAAIAAERPPEDARHPNVAFAEEYGAPQAINLDQPRARDEAPTNRVQPGEDLVENVGQESADNLAQTINEALPPTPEENNQRFFEIIGVDPTTPRMTKPATKPVDIEGNRRDYTATGVAANPEAVIEKAPAPETEEVAQQVAQRVLSREGTGKPSMVDVYNAVGLAKMKIISPEQLQRYARTGQLDAPAKRKIEKVTTDGVTTFFDVTGDAAGMGRPVSQVRTGPSASDDSSDLEIFKAQRELLENRYRDSKGKIDEGRVQRTLEQIETASDILKLTKKQRQDRSLLTSMATGQQFVDRFSADPSQTFDFNPFSDPELGPNNMALGFLADQMGITNQTDADRFLFQYGITLRNAFPRMSAEHLLQNAHRIELEAGNNAKKREELVEEAIAAARKRK